MVTTTTKTLNYSITKGNNTNSVNATITSTPGFNTNYLGKIPGILKLLELALAITALVLIAVVRKSQELRTEADLVVLNATSHLPILDASGQTIPLYKKDAVTGQVIKYANGQPVPVRHVILSNFVEMYLPGEVYFLCAHTAVITLLVIILGAYLFHTTSAMIVPKATTVENVANIILALLLLAAGIVEIVMVVLEVNRLNAAHDLQQGTVDKPNPEWPVNWRQLDLSGVVGFVERQPERFAAAALALLNGLLFLGSFILSRKELAGPKSL